MARKKTPKLGRPPKHPGERLSKTRIFRVRDRLDAQLQKAAALAKRPVSEEIEYRLEQSFAADPLFAALTGGDESAKVLRMIAWAMQLQSGEGSWKDNLLTAETVRVATNRILAEVAGLPEAPLPPLTDMAREEATERERRGEKVPQLEGGYLAAVLLAKAGVGRGS
jgi:hypothetical protein